MRAVKESNGIWSKERIIKKRNILWWLKQPSFSKKQEDLAEKLPQLRVNRPVVLFEIVNAKRQMIKMSNAQFILVAGN